MQILKVLIPILIGLGFRQLRIFRDEEGEVLRRFVVRFTVPVLVFFSMYDAQRDTVAQMPALMLAFVLITGSLFLLGWLSSRVVREAAQKTATTLPDKILAVHQALGAARLFFLPRVSALRSVVATGEGRGHVPLLDLADPHACRLRGRRDGHDAAMGHPRRRGTTRL